MAISPGAFRLFLALVVVVNHFSRISLGGAAVNLFFVLSGYWVTRLWTTKYSLTDYPYRIFVVSRLWRLLPVFLLANLAAHVVAGRLPSFELQQLVPNFLLLGFANLGADGFLRPAWSIDIELQFYLIFPAVYICARSAKSFAVLTIVSAIGLGLLLFSHQENFSIVLGYLSFFVIGVWAYFREVHVSKKVAGYSALASSLLVSVFLAFEPLRGAILGGLSATRAIEWNQDFNVLLSMTAVPLALNTVRNASSKLDRILSDLTYVLYLLHWSGLIIFARVFPGVQGVPRLFATALILTGTLLLAVAVLFFFDRPLNQLRERFVAKRITRRRETKPPLDLAHLAPEAQSPN